MIHIQSLVLLRESVYIHCVCVCVCVCVGAGLWLSDL